MLLAEARFVQPGVEQRRFRPISPAMVGTSPA